MSMMNTIKEGEEEEETNQDEELKYHVSEDELERSELSLSDVIHHDSPVKKLDLLTSSDPGCLTFSSDDTDGLKAGDGAISVIDDSDGLNASEVQSDWSNDNMRSELKVLNRETDKDGLLFCDDKVLIKPTHTVSETISAIEDSVSLNKSKDELNWLADHMINEFELQNDGIVEEISFSEPNFLLSESKDDMNWLRNNLNQEFELQNHEIIKNDPFSEPNCSKPLCHDSPVKISNLLTSSDPDCLTSSCDDTKIECTSPSNLSATEDSDGLNDELKMANHETHKDDTALYQPSLVSETTSNMQYSVNLKFSEDELNWLMDNLSNEFKMQNNGSINEDPSSVLNFPSSESDGSDWLRDNLSNEFDLEINGSINEDPFSVLNSSKSFCDDTELDQLSPRNTPAENITELEIYTPDEENKDPNAFSVKSLKEGPMEDVSSPVVNKENNNISFSEQLINSVDENYSEFLHGSLNDVEKVDPFVYCEEQLFSSSEKEIKTTQLKTEGSCYPQTVQNVIDSSHDIQGGEKKRWTMVVDANSLLHVESLKRLKLLEGLKGTQIIIPTIVIRELMNIQCQDIILKRNAEKVSLALKWIEECMARTRWWIHMDDEIIRSSDLESEVLETAIRLRTEITDRNIIILSNNLTLKIKAMAEGIMCEGAEEFHRSLVNPFSDRFMWVGSIARGLTWSSINDDILRQKYYGFGLNGSRGLKGLKLLAH
ncbi:uncharacterized protein [Rutidosis leptorrhynchoides]|uniref:uncharacterized protein n=1 Tax=Rutidosis leptorrhynchoides TaxID=125765 RepID=UPI003A9A2E34